MAVKYSTPMFGFSGRHLFGAVGMVVIATSVAFGQGDATRPGNGAQVADASADMSAFDVVSVKTVDPNAKDYVVGLQPLPDGIRAEHMPVSILIRAAYGGFSKLPTEDSVSGLPDWAKSEAFDVEAKMSPEQAAEFAKLDKSGQEERREVMLQALLADQFKLKVHREPKQVPDYELVIAKGGPKLKEGDAPNPNGPKDRDGNPISGSYLMMRKNGQVTVQAFTMEQVANFLGQGPMGLGRMVKDKTGLTGKYSFELNWTPDAALGSGSVDGIKMAPQAVTDDGGPSIFTALQEQLGLKLQPGTGMIDLVVVDHVEKPTPN